MARYVSMHGLDLSFMHTSPPVKRTRKKASRAKSKRSSLPCPVLITDIKPFVSPIDGSEITSRSKLRSHEQRHGVKQAGDFKRGELIAKENKRVAETQRLADPGSIKWE